MLSKKPITKDHILCDSIYMKHPDKANSQKQCRFMLPRPAGEGKKGDDC